MAQSEILHIMQTYKTMLIDVHNALHEARDVVEDVEAYILAGDLQEGIGLVYHYRALRAIVHQFEENNKTISDLEQRADKIIEKLES